MSEHAKVKSPPLAPIRGKMSYQPIFSCKPILNRGMIIRDRIPDLNAEDFKWVDKDGFELSVAEQKFYYHQKWLLNEVLYKNAYHLQWFTVRPECPTGLRVDHSFVVHRAAFEGEALEQILEFDEPGAQWLAQLTPKWGIDLAIEHFAPEQPPVEVLHIEVDSYSAYDMVHLIKQFEAWVPDQDWSKHAQMIRDTQKEWGELKGYAQNDWKAKAILGWDKSEYTLKAFR